MKDFNPFTGIAQFVMSCIILCLFSILFIGQIYVAGEWHDWMGAGIVIIALCVTNCVASWREYQQDK